MNLNKIKKNLSLLLVLLYFVILLPTQGLAAANTNLQLGYNYYGFDFESQKEVSELDATVMQFTHSKTGTKLVYVDTDDDNKVFTIGFRTPIKNSTGVNHILEHSVLCGSKNYPVKDPFLIMMSQSLNTYLNAYTSIDFTAYPVASKNDKDFYNLMGIYLDAVFNPSILTNKNIFMQEGWRYELASKDAPLKLNGIVYNEMKGVFSQPDRILGYEINKSLYPDTMYKYVSGGDPENIPDLTYEEFVNTHKALYHPSNSIIYLYGKMDIKKALDFIDRGYLRGFDKAEPQKFEEQKAFDKRNVLVSEYSVANDASTEDKTYLALNYVIGKPADKENVVAFSILDELLFGDASPFKKALDEKKFGSTVKSSYDAFMLQPAYSMIVENSNENVKDDFQKTVDEELRKIVKNGFSKDFINATINNYEFTNKKQNSSAERGLSYNDLMILSWNYGGDPTLYLGENDVLAKIKKSVDDKYFEKLIEKALLNNNHSSLVVLKPVPGLDAKKEAELNKKLADYKAKLTDEEINTIIKENQGLVKWQETPDTEEQLKSIPTLSISDINKEPEITPTEEKKVKDVTVLSHPIFTNDITHSNLYFDASKVPQDKIFYLHLLGQVLGRVETKKYSRDELSTEMSNNIGDFNVSTMGYWKYNADGAYVPKTNVYFSSLDENMPKAFDIVDEILNRSKFDNKEDLKNIIQETRSNLENTIMSSGHSVGLDRLNSYFSEAGKYNQTTSLDFYNFICDLDKNFDKKSDEAIKNLNDVKDIIFNKNGLLASYTGDKEKYNNFEKNFSKFVDKLNSNVLPAQTYKFDFSNKNEGIMIPSKVQYVIKGYDYSKLGYKYNGNMQVLMNILSNDYMWPELRVKGGAYGGYFTISKSGFLAFYSYRDPNLKETLNVYDNAAEFIKNFKATDEEMTNYIIGAIGGMDYLKDPADKGKSADSNYIRGITDEDLKAERLEVLNTKASDIVKYADMIEKAMKENYHCTIGNEKKITENKGAFNSIKNGLNE